MSSTQQLLLGEGAGGAAPVYIEDVFSTYLWTGNGTSQTITNNIDLSTKGGLVWIKRRDGVVNHYLATTNDGTSNYLNSNTTSPYETSVTTRITSFNTDGFSLGSAGSVNNSGSTFVGWTFREQPKFFDVVTYTGNDVAGRTISHSLGSAPGTIIIKRTNSSNNWAVYHRSLGATKAIFLNSTDAAVTSAAYWNNTEPTSTVFSIGDAGAVNEGGASAGTYVAYIFAHDAGGFGLTGTDNVVSCGSWTASSTVAVNVTLGYEPQYVLVKNASAVQNWLVWDTMRGMPVDTAQPYLHPNLSSAESSDTYYLSPTATGFTVRANALGSNGNTYIYIAIRRGPMKVPTVGTSVFAPVVASVSSSITVTTGFPVDMSIGTQRQKIELANNYTFDRLRGSGKYLSTNNTNGESGTGTTTSFNTSMTAYIDNYSAPVFGETSSYGTNIYWNFRRAPSFFDEVCYTGTGVNRTVAHNLGVVPELMIFKVRASITDSWQVYCSALSLSGTSYLLLNDAATAQTNGSTRFTGAPTSTLINLATNGSVNGSGNTYVAYLFATCAGVSKVGSYTGTGTTKQIDCGFTGGARFVLIKRTNSTGDWYVWDSARGIVSGNDPYLLMNSTAAEVTNTDYIDTYSAGFEISSTAPAAINASGATYIFLAIA